MKLDKLRSALRKRFGDGVEAREDRGSIVLEGQLPSWEARLEAGSRAVGAGSRGVVNDIVADDCAWAASERLDSPRDPGRDEGEKGLEGLSFDVAVIGGGVVGCAVARELAKWRVSTILLEKEEDVAFHASSRNDGMIHDGFAARPGSLKAKFNILGNRLWEALAWELGIEFRRPGSIVLFRNAATQALYPAFAARAAMNHVDGWEYWSPRRVRAEEPNVCDGQHGAFFLPSAGVISPYRATVALAESAVMNGVRVELGTCVKGFEKEGDRIARVRTDRGDFRASVVVNAAGNWADVVASFADDRFFSLHQRRGTDMILDSQAGGLQRHIMAMPSIMQAKSTTKGGGLVTTVEGNILVGPTATELPGRESYATSTSELRTLERHFRINRRLLPSMAITYFAGVRACTWEEDFIIERSRRVANLVHAAGIQSPGLASAPAIAEEVARISLDVLCATMKVSPNASFVAVRDAPLELRRLSLEERAKAVSRNPSYGRIVCRCEEVSEGEIRDAMKSPLPVRSLDAVKRRARPGMGRCHGGFCTPRVMEIVADELGIGIDEVTKKGPGSRIAVGMTKSGLGEGFRG